MVMDVNAVGQNAYGRASELQGLEAHGAVAVRDPQSHNEPQLANKRNEGHNGVTSGVTSNDLTDGNEVTLLGAKSHEPSPVPAAKAAQVYAKGTTFRSEDDDSEVGPTLGKKEAKFESVGIKARAIPTSEDPDDPAHARAARDIVEAEETRKQEAKDERAEKERRVMDIMRNPARHGFPVDA